jgi:hypothetical protein
MIVKEGQTIHMAIILHDGIAILAFILEPSSISPRASLF